MPERVIKISDVIHHLQEAKKKFGNLICIQCSDDEGNSYQRVLFTPTLMKTTANLPKECYDIQVTEDAETPNCICLN